MTVYVDEFRKWGRSSLRCFKDGSCHLTADSLQELHHFARRLGLMYVWFQDHPTAPHYDLTGAKRALALQLGAVFKGAMQQARERLARRKDDSR